MDELLGAVLKWLGLWCVQARRTRTVNPCHDGLATTERRPRTAVRDRRAPAGQRPSGARQHAGRQRTNGHAGATHGHPRLTQDRGKVEGSALALAPVLALVLVLVLVLLYGVNVGAPL